VLSVSYARMDEPKALAGLDVERLGVVGHSSNGSAAPSTRVPDPERGGGSSLDGLLATSSPSYSPSGRNRRSNIPAKVVKMTRELTGSRQTSLSFGRTINE
jgi:hypothetical protein